MGHKIQSTFEIESWDEHPIDEARPKVTRATVTKRFRGGIDGTSRIEYVMAYREDGSAAFVGIERVAGTIDGRQGSMVLRHVGSFESGAARASVEVVDSSGADGLAGVAGAGDFIADPAGSMNLDLTFGES
jgi:hypothetical protein